ncbi:bromo adjacent homology domain-containing 1 protein [Caerostris darwini]|uniref:Bromo adjacent homology domain-containing 1 protein n=1 Tax=Caerostris darwini TaxID=1538125 RepID=A0AAV4PBI4_9ARAC|nr:bromo adjacent homology domain-containing 1 protein [Caerostris darwini]
MKDSQVKPVPSVAKSKPGIKKEKMPVKKAKEPKAPTPKVKKPRKYRKKNPETKIKIKQEIIEEVVVVPKRKRGRPRNDEKLQNLKKVKEEPKPPKNTESKGPGRKRKNPPSVGGKNEKEDHQSPNKKLKTNDVNCNMNGNAKMPLPSFHKSCGPKGESSLSNDHPVVNNSNCNSNGLFHCKNNVDSGPKKSSTSPSSSKTVTFGASPPKSAVNNSFPSKSGKSQSNKTIKGILKNDIAANHHPKDTTPQISPENIKVEKVDEVSVPQVVSPVKLHPQRMASLDALAKMHVICIPDRKPVDHHSKSVASSVVSVPFGQQNSLTQCHQRIHFDLKKEGNDFNNSIVHKQINYVKEKEHVFVSHSVEQQSKTVSTKTQSEKKKRDSSSSKASKASGKEPKQNQSAKAAQTFPNNVEKKSKVPKDKKSKVPKDKTVAKATKATKKSAKEQQQQPTTKVSAKKSKKLEQTKSEVKVKETLLMQKTCTYQSVTTVNSNGTTNSSVVPMSHVDLTTNYSKTKKTVVTEEECKNKINYSSDSVVNNTYCITSESPCSVSHHADCCKFHSHPSTQIIPLAHVQTCALGHGLARTSDSSSSSSPSHCDGNFSVHRFGHQQAVLYSPSSPEYVQGLYCPNSLVQNVHDPCLMRKSIIAYPNPHQHHTHHAATNNMSPEPLCTEFHTSNSSVDPSKHHAQSFGLPSPSYSRINCCSCCDHHRENNHQQQHHHHQSPAGNCLQYLSPPKNSASLVPCEQSPLDLSRASASSGSSMDSDHLLQQSHCSNQLCCGRDLLLVRTSTPHGFQHGSFPAQNAMCCRYIKQVSSEGSSAEPASAAGTAAAKQMSQAHQCSSKNLLKDGQPSQVADHLALATAVPPTAAAAMAKAPVVPPVPSTSGAMNKNASRIATENLVPTKREKCTSPKQPVKLPVPKKKQFAHGWSWKGKPREKLIALTNDSTPIPRLCYPSIEHIEGDIISEKDCVLLKSGPKDTDLPYVAKVFAFWENPEDGEMMMSLLWYYRPEHTDQGRKPGQMEDEVFASRHKDVNSIACIEDKCYVLTYNEYCRYKGISSMEEENTPLATILVPELPDGYPRKSRLPIEVVANDIVFFCRHVYDFRQKRILKNPT